MNYRKTSRLFWVFAVICFVWQVVGLITGRSDTFHYGTLALVGMTFAQIWELKGRIAELEKKGGQV